MKRRMMTSIVATAMLGALAGCSGNQEIRAEMVNIRDRSNHQMDLLKKSNELLNRKLNRMNDRVGKLQESNDRLSTELTEYATRPEEIKLEIITEVNTRFAAMAKGHEDFVSAVNSRFDTKTAEMERELTSSLEALAVTLDEHAVFVHFVSSEQDSINRVFATRFDSRPWYQSVLGKWDDMGRSRQDTP